MASIDTGGGGKQKKGQQKKISLRVDFTPMVDMNMLLITFFMFCTSLSKPQTMEINMPSKDAPTNPVDGTTFADSRAITILLGGYDKVYYYLGMLKDEKYDDPNFLIESSYSPEGLRALLLSRNGKVNGLIDELKVKKLNKEITEEEFKKQSIEYKKDDSAPQIMIKAAENSNYKNLIDALDEMQICNVGVYAIVDMTDGDKYLMYQKTGDPTYAVDLKKAPGVK